MAKLEIRVYFASIADIGMKLLWRIFSSMHMVFSERVCFCFSDSNHSLRSSSSRGPLFFLDSQQLLSILKYRSFFELPPIAQPCSLGLSNVLSYRLLLPSALAYLKVRLCDLSNHGSCRGGPKMTRHCFVCSIIAPLQTE